VILIVTQLPGSLRSQTQDAGIVYFYDELGQLIAVMDGTGETATYTRDKRGNILSIARRNSSAPAILHVTPSRGPVGSLVTITGIGFGATPAENVVTFNGAATAVTAATTTLIQATVPAGAATGLVAVTTSRGSATSAAPFTVTASTDAPAITGFTPTIGPPGTAVTITGARFEPSPIQNRVAFNASSAAVLSSTASTIATSVPSGAGSGRVSVATPFGKALSSTDFFVPPSPFAAAAVAVTGRLTISGESRAILLDAPNKIALMLFEGSRGVYVSLGLTSLSTTGVYISIYRPDGTLLVTRTWIGGAGGAVDTPPLPSDGTYTIMIESGRNTGSMTLTLSAEISSAMMIGGAENALVVAKPGQNARVSFSGRAAQQVSLAITAVTIAGSYVSIYGPTGSLVVVPTWVNTGGGVIDLPPLPMTGTYTIAVAPSGVNTGAMTLLLSEEIALSIALDGAPLTINIARPGQRARVTFSGTAGRHVGLGITAATIPGSYVSIYNPSPDPLVANQPYDIRMEYYDNRGSAQAQLLWSSPSTPEQVVPAAQLSQPKGGSGLTGEYFANATLSGAPSLTRTDPNVNFNWGTGSPSPSVPGDQFSVRWRGEVRAQYSEAYTFCTLTDDGARLWVNGQLLIDRWTDQAATRHCTPTLLTAPAWIASPGGRINVPTLPASGTYSVLIDPYALNTGSMTVTLSAELTLPIAIDGAPVPLTIMPGQTARVGFAGQPGQRLSLGITSVTLAGSYVSVYKPDGAILISRTWIATAGGAIDMPPLPSAGTFVIVVEPNGTNSGNMTLTLSEELRVPIVINGSPVAAKITRPAQNIRLSFDGLAGQRVGSSLTSVTIAGSYVSLLRPDGTALVAPRWTTTAGNFVVAALPSNGTYTILLDPYSVNTGDATLRLSVASLSATPTSVPAGGVTTVTWSDIGLPRSGDWIGLFAPGAADSADLAFRYTTGTSSGSAPLTIPASLAAGSYELRLFAAGSTRLATSAPLNVTRP
jgi:YD repeat-containing protein